MKRTLLALSLVGLLAACGESLVITVTDTAPSTVPESDVEAVELTEAGDACAEFYRAAAASGEEEHLFMRRLAESIAGLGHTEAAVILDDLASQWEVGIWEGEQDEVWQSGLWAEAGRLLGDQGAVRCRDLAEWWGIDGYEGEPEPGELLRRQAQIWRSGRPSEYFVLFVGGRPGEQRTQVHAHVVGDQVVGSATAAQGPLPANELPLSVEQLYSWLLDQPHRVERYDLADGIPSVVEINGIFLRALVDPEEFPPPVETGIGDEETG